MNKAELVAAVAEKAGMTRKDTEKVLNSFTDVVYDTLKAGDKVQIVGFGSFEVKARAARKGHNPATGAELDIPASKAPVFKAGKVFKDIVS